MPISVVESLLSKDRVGLNSYGEKPYEQESARSTDSANKAPNICKPPHPTKKGLPY